MFLIVYSHKKSCIPLYLKKYTNIQIYIFFLKKEFIQAILHGAHYYLDIHQYKILLEDFPFPSLSLLSKINKRKIDAIKYSQALKKDDKISQDICLLFDDMYLQKCEDYLGGELIGSDENRELDKAIV